VGALTRAWRPLGDDPIELSATVNTMAASASDALGGLGEYKRQPREFRVATQAEKMALSTLTKLVVGDTVQVGSSIIEEFTPTGWALKSTPQSIPFAVDWAGSSIQPGASTPESFRYSVEDDIVTVFGTIVGNGSDPYFLTADRHFIRPPLPIAVDGSNVGVIGQAAFTWGSPTVRFTTGVIFGRPDFSGVVNLQLLAFRNGPGGMLNEGLRTGFPNPLTTTIRYAYRRLR